MSDSTSSKLEMVADMVTRGEVRVLGIVVVTDDNQFFVADLNGADVPHIAMGRLAADMLKEELKNSIGTVGPGCCDECGGQLEDHIEVKCEEEQLN